MAGLSRSLLRAMILCGSCLWETTVAIACHDPYQLPTCCLTVRDSTSSLQYHNVKLGQHADWHNGTAPSTQQTQVLDHETNIHLWRQVVSEVESLLQDSLVAGRPCSPAAGHGCHVGPLGGSPGRDAGLAGHHHSGGRQLHRALWAAARPHQDWQASDRSYAGVQHCISLYEGPQQFSVMGLEG